MSVHAQAKQRTIYCYTLRVRSRRFLVRGRYMGCLRRSADGCHGYSASNTAHHGVSCVLLTGTASTKIRPHQEIDPGTPRRTGSRGVPSSCMRWIRPTAPLGLPERSCWTRTRSPPLPPERRLRPGSRGRVARPEESGSDGCRRGWARTRPPSRAGPRRSSAPRSARGSRRVHHAIAWTHALQLLPVLCVLVRTAVPRYV